MKDKLLGVVLCGGKSLRMGMDKGLILQFGKPWAMHAAEKLTGLGLKTVVSVNCGQVQAYGRYFDSGKLITDDSELPGPLRGILSVYHRHPENDLLVLACDMTDMDVLTLNELLERYSEYSDYELFGHHNGRFWEPLCGIYTSPALQKVSVALQKDHLERYDLHYWMEEISTLKIDVTRPASFANYNSLKSSNL
jgi:molybdopterin-guanine dinucleotide biosynthesis protein A